MIDKIPEILLVEDNPDDEELTRFALNENHIVNRLTVVHDGAEALEYVFCTGAYSGRNIKDQPALILLDLKLPKIDGVQVLELIKADPRTKTIPIVMLTSSREGPDVAKCYALGVNSYIVKPVDFDQFKDAVKQLGLYWLVLNEPPSPD